MPAGANGSRGARNLIQIVEPNVIAHSDQIDFGRFILAVTAIVVLLLLVYRLSRRAVRERRSSPMPTHQAPAVRQVAAIPVRVGSRGDIEVLIVSTRGSGRWTVPKGWPMRGRSDADAAAQEAFEEAGVRGLVATDPLGTFEYAKRKNEGETLAVTVYRLDVTSHEPDWRERDKRKQLWLTPAAAADRVAWPGLAVLIRSLETRQADSL